MTRSSFINDALQPVIVPAEFQASWAGSSPALFNAQVCLGGEDGELIFMPNNGNWKPGVNRFISTGDAVNGVAFIENRIAISSRSEIAIVMIRREDEAMHAIFPAGAHDVIATHSGYFVAPLGISGMMLCRPDSVQVFVKRGERVVNLYKISSFWDGTTDAVACAARQDGVYATPLPESADKGLDNVHWFRFHDFDAVDICSLGSRSAAVLGADGSFVLVHDILSENEKPTTMSFPDVLGTGYGILTVQGHIVVLTSRALCIYKDLARRFKEGCSVDREATFVLVLPVEAVDVNRYDDSKLLLILPDAVLLANVEMLMEPKLPSMVPQKTNGRYEQEREKIAHRTAPSAARGIKHGIDLKSLEHLTSHHEIASPRGNMPIS